MAGEDGTSIPQPQDAPQDVQQPAAEQQPAKPAVKRYRRAELDEEEEKQQLLLEDGEDE